MALPFSFQFNPRWFPSFVRRFLFHAIIHNNNRQVFFSFVFTAYSASTYINFLLYSPRFAGWLLLYERHLPLTVTCIRIFPSLAFTRLTYTHRHLHTFDKVYQITSDAQNGIVSLRSRELPLPLPWERDCIRSSRRTKKIIKSATGRKRVLVFACFAIIPLPIPIAIHYVCTFDAVRVSRKMKTRNLN